MKRAIFYIMNYISTYQVLWTSKHNLEIIILSSMIFWFGLGWVRAEATNLKSCFFQVVAFNRTVEKVEQFLQNEAKGTKVVGAKSLEDMVSKLKKPRRVMLLVKAGQAVDDFILKLVRDLSVLTIKIQQGCNFFYAETQNFIGLKVKMVNLQIS